MKPGDRIREFRKKKQLTQEQFAEILGYSQGYLTEIETGKKEPSREVLKKIHEKFGMSTDYFLFGLVSTSWGEIESSLTERGLEQEFLDKIHALFISAVIHSADEANLNLSRAVGRKIKEIKAGLTLDQIPRPYCSFVGNLAEIPKDIRTEDYISVPLVEGSIAAGEPIISEDKIEGWTIIHASQVGHRPNLVAIRIDQRDGKSMEPYLQAGSMVAIDRDDREMVNGKIYAVRTEWGCTIKFLKRQGDFLILIPGNKYHEPEVIDLAEMTTDPIVGRIIWNWQTL